VRRDGPGRWAGPGRRPGLGRWVMPGRWAGPVAGAGLAAVAGLGLVRPAGPVETETVACWLLLGAGWLAAGEAVRWRRPAHPVGALLAAAGLLLLAAAAGARALPLDLTARVAVLAGLGLFPAALVVFPDRPLPRVAGPVALGTALVTTAVALVRPADAGVVGSMALVSAVAVLAAGWWRFEAGDPAQRRALLWPLLATCAVLVVGGPQVFLLTSMVPPTAVAALVPAALAVGVLRPDAGDVRTLTVRVVVLAVTVTLYVALFAGVLAAVRAAGGEPGTGAAAVVGAVLAAAFAPTRTVLHGVIDELLFGGPPDPARAMAGVGERLADDPVLALRALRQALLLPYAALLVDGAVLASSGTATTPTLARPLRGGDGPVGELVVGLRPGELRLRAGDEAVLDVVAPALGQALHARLLAGALRRSRDEVVSAGEEERRRLRRDLHDGLGPTLTGVAYATDAARNLLRADPAAADALLADLRADVSGAIAEVRRLVDGLRPPLLDELGLAGAIRLRARQLRTADGLALAVAVDAPEPLPPVPAAVEVAAYRIVVEALTNVCRHAGSDRAAVTLRLHADRLELEVADGGGPADWVPGVGLTSMRERAESVGGWCVAGGTPAGGRVAASLPVLPDVRVGQPAVP
jgi:two-component system, NarL family, sensor kinase